MLPAVKALQHGILTGSRLSLAKSITLLESSRKQDIEQSLLLLDSLYQRVNQRFLDKPELPLPEYDSKNKSILLDSIIQKDAIRIGISGPPGAGKSTFLESFGTFLLQCSPHVRIAILAVDPSSQKTGGSILGDKTRMPILSNHERVFIRPSPSRGFLGGVTQSTNESLVLCEAVGYNILFVETVGVGQSETSVFDMTDIFLLIEPPAGGDELQVCTIDVGPSWYY